MRTGERRTGGKSLGMAALALACLFSLPVFGFDADRAMMAELLRMEVASRVVSEAGKIDGSDEVASAAASYRGKVVASVRERLTALLGDSAQTRFAAFVDEAGGNPGRYGDLRATVAREDIQDDIAAAGKFLGDVQTWARLKAKGEVPPLATWLSREAKPGGEGAGKRAVAKKKKSNALRDAEAEAGTFVEADDDGASSLRSFGEMRSARRKKAMEEAQAGMSQVAEQRRVADEEANSKKIAAAQAEAAAQQAHAQRLAAAEQEAVVQDQNSWKTRMKSVVSSAIGSAGGAFLGSIGSRVGEEAARAVFEDGPRRR